MDVIKEYLFSVSKNDTLISIFEFNKDQIIGLDLHLFSLFNISFTGIVKNAKELSIKVNRVTKSRITNIATPRIEILRALSAFSEKES